MKFVIGTSGYSYKEWKGSFYPEKLPQKEMLSFYAQRFPTVEINNTFRRLPDDSVFESWAAQVPAAFRFALKAPQLITHYRRLNNVENETKDFLRAAALLNKRLGPLYFQLPPNFKKDVPRLDAFCKLLGKGTQAAFEFRHESWFDDEVYACLRKHKCTLCIADSDDCPRADVVATTNWGYIRLRRERYTIKQLETWLAKFQSQPWRTAYVFFKHEDTGTGPKFAEQFAKLANS